MFEQEERVSYMCVCVFFPFGGIAALAPPLYPFVKPTQLKGVRAPFVGRMTS